MKRGGDDHAESNQAYGALTEGFYLASFTFERAMTRVLWLLKEGRWMTVGNGFDDVNAFIRSLPMQHFKVLAEQRKEFVQKVKELQPQISNRAIGDALGVAPATIDRAAASNEAPDAGKAQGNGGRAASNEAPGAAAGRRDARIIGQRGEREERREAKLKSIGAAAALSGLFPVLYADPPWEDEFGHSGRDTEDHYPVMDLDAIKALPVIDIAPPDAVLYLWALPHMHPSGVEVMTAWGFNYRTEIIWGKEGVPGIGQYVRNQHENLLIGRRGKFPPPAEALRPPSLIMAPRGAHSEKPAIFAELIERWYPAVPKIELFCRGSPRPGWAAWGNEATVRRDAVRRR